MKKKWTGSSRDLLDLDDMRAEHLRREVGLSCKIDFGWLLSALDTTLIVDAGPFREKTKLKPDFVRLFKPITLHDINCF